MDSQMNYNNKNMLVGALLVAGYDEHSGGQVGVATHRAQHRRRTWFCSCWWRVALVSDCVGAGTQALDAVHILLDGV